MGTTLTGTTPQDTYDSLIKVTDNGPLSGTLKALSDGLGNDSTLSLSTTAASIAGTLSVTGNATFDTSTLFVDAANNRVGVGTITPDSKVRIQNDNATVPSLTIRDGGTPTVDHIRVSSGTYGDAFFVGATGLVGIGTSAPASPLSVGGTALYNLPASTANFSTADTGKFQLRLTSSSFNADGNWIGLGMGFNQDYMKTAIIARATDGAGRGTINFCLNNAATSANVSLSDTRVTVTTNGLTFNGDTAAANALDDYEEGTWTMGISFGNASVGVTYSNNTGTYTKIGRQVTVNGLLYLSSKGSSTGAARITGLPFTIANTNGNYSAASLWLNNITFLNQYNGVGGINSTAIGLEEVTTLGVYSQLTDVDFANNSEIILSLTYFV